LRHLSGGVDNSRHQVEVARTQASLLTRQSFTDRRPTLRRSVPRRIPPLRHRPDTTSIISVIIIIIAWFNGA